MEYEEGRYYDIKRRSEIRNSARRLRKKYLKYKEAEVIYSLSHKMLLKLCSEAGALYRREGTVLIDRDIFDEYLEKYHEPARKPKY